jgi:hypothetical protein
METQNFHNKERSWVTFFHFTEKEKKVLKRMAEKEIKAQKRIQQKILNNPKNDGQVKYQALLEEAEDIIIMLTELTE